MDELHIAQFAALLRTLAKVQGRQVIVAVHERPLFEYLALELSPAFPGDKLITVELGRSAAGSTRYDPTVIAFERSEEHTSELQSLMRISYAVFCLKKKTSITP